MGGTKRSLALYLRGHHAAGAAAVGQVRRQAAACRDGDLGLLLVRLSKEIAEDRVHLAHVMTKLGVKPARLRALLARAFGWLARWFIRAHAPGRPQALLIGLETLSLGIEGKASLWRTLREVAVGEPRIGDVDFDALLARAEDQRGQLEPHRLEVALQANANSYSNGSRVTAKGKPHQPDPSEIPAPSSLAGSQAASRQPKPEPSGVLSRSTVVTGRPASDQEPAAQPAPASAASSDATAVLPAVKDEPAKDSTTASSSDATAALPALTNEPAEPAAAPPEDQAEQAGATSHSDDQPEAAENEPEPAAGIAIADAPAADQAQSEDAEAGAAPEAATGATAETEPGADSKAEAGTGTDTAVSTNNASTASADAEAPADTEAAGEGEAEEAELSEEEQRKAAEAAIEAEAQKLLAEVESEVEAKLKAEAEPPESKPSRWGRAKTKRTPAVPAGAEAPAPAQAQETVAMPAVKPEPKGNDTAAVEPAAAAKRPAARKPAAAKKASASVFVAKAAKPKKAAAKQVFVPRPKVGIDDEPPAPPARPARRKPRGAQPQRVVIDPKKLSTLKFEAIKGDKPPAE